MSSPADVAMEKAKPKPDAADCDVCYLSAVRIGLLKYRAFHDSILRPAADRLSRGHQCLLTGDERELLAFRPHVVVLGESSIIGRLRDELPTTLFVHTRHGLASKNATYRGAAATDYMCVTSPFVRSWYEQSGSTPRRGFWVVGYLQMDPLFRNEPLPRPVAVPEGRKTVLYAPTWNATLSSAPMLGPRLAELIRGGRDDVSLVIKPHPLIAKYSPDWIAWWQQLAANDPHVHLVQDMDCDVIPFLQMADVLVTDASSVQLEYLATDRPMVLISNPTRFGSKDFDAKGFEWTWRDMGEEIFDADSLPGAVATALDRPAARALQRAKYRELLFGDLTDGRTCERICDNIERLRSTVSRVQLKYAAAWPWRKAARGVKKAARWLTRASVMSRTPALSRANRQ